MKAMGFGGFNSSKGKKVATNQTTAARGNIDSGSILFSDIRFYSCLKWADGSIPGPGAVMKHKTNEYRQYMNRRGGFNRPLGSESQLSQNGLPLFIFFHFFF